MFVKIVKNRKLLYVCWIDWNKGWQYVEDGIKWYDEMCLVSNDAMMLIVLLEIVQDFQCTMSLSSSAAPLDDETKA